MISPSFETLSSGRPVVMGIVNVTPDSFSDGGDHATTEAALAHGRRLLDEGARILDVGGESTRPGASPVSVDEEMSRVIPVIQGLRSRSAVISVDTRHLEVMQAAAEAGAQIVNDVSALQADGAIETVAGLGVSVVLMHMQGEPGTMQENPQYDNVVEEVRDFLAERVAACEAKGIARERIAIDPGIGFGKTVAQNLDLIKGLGRIAEIGLPIVIGVSRKSFIGAVTGETSAKDRLAGSLAAGLEAVEQGAQILRVHDVAATVQALSLRNALAACGRA